MKSILLHDSPDEYAALLCAYAAGTLDDAHALLVATHVSLCGKARRFVSQCESVGGSLLESCCDPAPLSRDCLTAVLSQIDSRGETFAPRANESQTLPEDDLPKPLRDFIENRPHRRRKWSAFAPGIKVFPLSCVGHDGVCVTLIHSAPGAKVPAHRHSGTEMALVLRGSFRDEHGSYRAGDLVVGESGSTHRPVAGPEGCLCLVLTEDRVVFSGLFGQILKLFAKIRLQSESADARF